jgi:hypothetical protein
MAGRQRIREAIAGIGRGMVFMLQRSAAAAVSWSLSMNRDLFLRAKEGVKRLQCAQFALLLIRICRRVRRTPQSQRDCVLKPRVARNELPWVTVGDMSNPERVASSCVPCLTQPRWGCDRNERPPRVVASLQPWALRRNPVGIRVCSLARLRIRSSSLSAL